MRRKEVKEGNKMVVVHILFDVLLREQDGP